jgi:hypothetical protein
MSGGYMVLIKNPPGGEAAKEIWFAHLGDMDKAVHAVETNTGAVRSQIIVLGTIRHAVLVDHLGVPEGEAQRFDGRSPSHPSAKENPG